MLDGERGTQQDHRIAGGYDRVVGNRIYRLGTLGNIAHAWLAGRNSLVFRTTHGADRFTFPGPMEFTLAAL